jgi:exodeoxyribonuclease-3
MNVGWHQIISCPYYNAIMKTLTVMTYNILDGGHQREALICEVLHAVQPDIVILQELDHPATLKQFANLLDAQSFFAPGNTKRHVGLISRYPIVTATSYRPFPPIRTSILAATIAADSTHPLHVFGVHLVPHLAWPLELWRCWELRVLLQQARSYDAEPCLIAGDFNTIAPGDRVNIRALPFVLKLMLWAQGGRVFHPAIATVLTEGYTDCYRTMHPQESGCTLPSDSPNARLDYLFANRVFAPRLRQCTIITLPSAVREASDHLPVVAEFELA